MLQTCLRTLGILRMHPRCEGHWSIFSRGNGTTNFYPPVMLNTLGPAPKPIGEMMRRSVPISRLLRDRVDVDEVGVSSFSRIPHRFMSDTLHSPTQC